VLLIPAIPRKRWALIHSSLALVILAGTARAADPPEALAKAREEARREVLAAKGVDASRWGEDVPNPFTNLTEEGRKKLKAAGVDVERLVKLKAVLLTGTYCGANAVWFVNRDPDTIVVLGKGFITHSIVSSVGPILAVEDAHIMGGLKGADVVWFAEKSWPRFQTTGLPLLVGPDSPQSHDPAVTARAVRDDFGWRRPENFLKPDLPKPTARPAALAIADAAKKKQDLADRIKAQAGVDPADLGEPVVNPFTNLSDEGKAKLKARGIDPERLARLKAVLVTGRYLGAGMKTFVNRDADTILILGKDFITHGQVFSLGPVLAVENAHFMSSVTGADVVWFVEKCMPRGQMAGYPVIVDPTAERSQMHAAVADVWYGDYGWRRGASFLNPAPIKLTVKELDALWAELPADDDLKAKRLVRKLIAGAEHSVPYLKERLRPEAPPKDEVLTRLIAELNDDEFEKREAASAALEKLGLRATAALQKALDNSPAPELRRRAELLMTKAEQDRRSIRRALGALEQIGSPEARKLLEELGKNLPDPVLSKEANAALKRLEDGPRP
jgi:hypothetical protein